MFALNEAVRGRLIDSKSWNRGVGCRNPCGQSVTVHGLMWVPSLCIYVKMCALMCMRPESAEKYGFTK